MRSRDALREAAEAAEASWPDRFLSSDKHESAAAKRARFTAAADPATVLGLLDELEVSEARAERAEELLRKIERISIMNGTGWLWGIRKYTGPDLMENLKASLAESADDEARGQAK